MTNLAICKNCRALTPDTDDDIAEHRRKHKEQRDDIERARKAASEATTALNALRATVRDYETALEQRAMPVEPEISMRVVDDEDDDEITDPELVTTQADAATISAPDDTAPPTTTIAAYPAIDRDDDVYDPFPNRPTA